MTDVKVLCGKNIAKYRKERGLSQHQLAKKVGIQHSSIAHYETYVTLPRAQVLNWLAEALGVKIYELFMECEE
jgi:transcriptional regulator with XRE-family HTH domain